MHCFCLPWTIFHASVIQWFSLFFFRFLHVSNGTKANVYAVKLLKYLNSVIHICSSNKPIQIVKRILQSEPKIIWFLSFLSETVKINGRKIHFYSAVCREWYPLQVKSVFNGILHLFLLSLYSSSVNLTYFYPLQCCWLFSIVTVLLTSRLTFGFNPMAT